MGATAPRLLGGRPLRTPRRLLARRLVISVVAYTRRPPSIPSTSSSTSAAVNVVLSKRWDALLEHISRTSTTSSGEPWKAQSWGVVESLAAMRVHEDTLGMTAFEFADTLGGHPSIYTKPIAVIKANAEDLAQQFGKKAARQLITKIPGALARGAWPSRVAYLQTELGWSAEEVQRLLQSGPSLPSCLDAPMVQYILQLCQEHLALDPAAVLLRHGELLRSAPQETAPRVTFIGQRNLGSKIAHKISVSGSSAGWAGGTPAGVSEISTSFMGDTDSGWASRLGKMGVIQQEWAALCGTGHDLTIAEPVPWFKIVVAGAKVCMTGSGPYTRQDLTDLLEEAGAEVQKTVGPDTNYLFCEDPNSDSAKLHKARSWGVKVISYDDLVT